MPGVPHLVNGVGEAVPGENRINVRLTSPYVQGPASRALGVEVDEEYALVASGPGGGKPDRHGRLPHSPFSIQYRCAHKETLDRRRSV
ncbi:MAG: hypothetical protein USCGTAYLOR_02479 [Chromatiales bacterium USCg_Taylor]|nr:MAG: hypothetical protein USCGTAYLOR_02479 [Chromatiales bacterium USCg_Taylor]